MDKNNVTGLLLISLLLMAYFFFFNPEEQAPQQTEGQQAAEQVIDTPVEEKIRPEQAPLITDDLPDSAIQEKFGFFATAVSGTSEEVKLENDEMVVTFDTHGAKIKNVLLKNYVDYLKEPLILISEESSTMSEVVKSNVGDIDLNDLYYGVEREGNSIAFTITQGEQSFKRVFSLEKTGFVMDYTWETAGLDNVIQSEDVDYYWFYKMPKLEKAIDQSRTRSTVNYLTADLNFDDLNVSSNDKETKKLELPAKWVSFKHKFFNSAIITDKTFEDVEVASVVPAEDQTVVKASEMAFKMPIKSLKGDDGNIRYYFGPNDYDICEGVAPSFERNVYLGWAFFATINLYLVIPLFEFLEGLFSNYGIVILILVFIVKTLLFPLTYKSYFSMAKTKVLKPELDEIKAKHGDDMQKVQSEQMKLYQQVGVNPISGCIPMLAQMPVFLALFNFFPNAIQLRQQSFLWAEDLSSFDSIYNFGFEIPFYGDHISLFTLLMAISQIGYTYYSNQMNAAAQGPAKTIGYITPLMFMFFFNNFASGLTYYYFVSNVITVGQQLLIRRFVDDSKIRKILDENKKKNVNKKKSSFQQRLEDAMKQQNKKK
ncbi:membrane protein insertase YidC [Flammeovirgaceae bacterium SG7u.111]|nr:membrane protein insertase YidC [Flammeovirgaceae bacterium SG7u.132]WPO34949.1 membrane protein insertase YidC [Flammeovirgaceae bacterium SG7u.111]